MPSETLTLRPKEMIMLSSREMLTFRNDPTEQEDRLREFTTRSFTVRAESVDDTSRSVEALVATEDPVTVFDWQRGELIDEVLRMDGVELPSQVPLLENHYRWSLDSVFGSTRSFRVQGSELYARLHFADVEGSDQPIERAWKKVKQRHLDSVSAGYRSLEYVDIPPGQTAAVKGRTYMANPHRTLRITLRWTPKEVSLVPVGADKRAKIRGESDRPHTRKDSSMNPKLKAFLLSMGLRADATDAQAQDFYNGLSAAEKQRADAAVTVPTGAPGNPPADTQRSELPGVPTAGTPPSDANRADPLAVERDRIRTINELADSDVPRELVTRALNEGWDVSRASREFLGAVRSARGPAGHPSQGPAIHSRSHEADCTLRSLAAGVLVSQGLDPTHYRSHDGRSEGQRFSEQDASLGDQFRRLSAIDLCRECVRLDGGRESRDPEESIRSAMSGASLTSVFTTNAYARLVQGWEKKGDTTGGWCDEEDVANFMQHEDIGVTANAGMKKLPRGGTAKDVTMSDSAEPYKIARFADKFVADEQDFIDDRLGAIMRMPMEMGEQAREVRPNLVYSTMLRNPSLADGGAVFNATAVTASGGHANLGTGVLNSANLKLAITAMGKQREGGRVLNITPIVLIVPSALEWTAEELLSPAMIAKLFANSTDPQFSMENLISRRGLRLVVDDRLGASGVIDPDNDNKVRAGSDTAWYLAAGGSKSIRVAYRRGTGRMPQMRSFTLDRGQWGIGWDINYDIGAAFMDYRPWYKSTGAA